MAELALKSPASQYIICKHKDGSPRMIGQTKAYTLYFCNLPAGKTAILKIAAALEHNPLMDREAFLLMNMREEAKRLEDEYAKAKEHPEQMLNYQLCFPNLVENFIAASQGGRRVSILDFPAVDDPTNLVPIGHLASRDRVRVDRKTSAWMMGKLLKILVFAHSQDMSIHQITDNNILIERKEHYVAVFDWSRAVIHTGGISADETQAEISASASVIIRASGGNPLTGEIPDDEQDPDCRYAKHLYDLCRGSEQNAYQAHTRFYALVRSLWPRGYWPFTAYDL